ncbi:MAG: superoxide dismutase [Candidatus Marinamargulisbacteria bacterium]|jgi:superoxide dismutase, Fe-Mn family|nr:superoxide dismutase [bacterium]MDG2265295.1 superoxide dismutase [Candidatus Marinamargulisbacteria bacterium]|tara:strand:- start:5797 stop:6393 length:597 start_codon:yes stop_codon:yes gene_type:complete
MYTLPELPYAPDALNGFIDTNTMQIHHGKHHQAYVTNVNAALADTPMASIPIDDLMGRLTDVPEAKRMAVRNNGGGHYNHSLFWECLSPKSGQAPSGALADAIAQQFGSFEAFKAEFETAAKTRFGSGWAWLSLNNGQLVVSSTPNQDNPRMDGHQPLLGLDVWEHAYYLQYQNRRPDYVAAFWNHVNWAFVSSRYSG